MKAQVQRSLTLLVFWCVQRRRSAFLRWPECSRRFTATAWHLMAVAPTLRVSPFSRSCWSAACCCSYATERPKRSSWGRWDASSCSSAPPPGLRLADEVSPCTCFFLAPRGVQPPVCSAAGICGGSGRVFVTLQSAGEPRHLCVKEGQRGSTQQGTNSTSLMLMFWSVSNGCLASTPRSLYAEI